MTNRKTAEWVKNVIEQIKKDATAIGKAEALAADKSADFISNLIMQLAYVASANIGELKDETPTPGSYETAKSCWRTIALIAGGTDRIKRVEALYQKLRDTGFTGREFWDAYFKQPKSDVQQPAIDTKSLLTEQQKNLLSELEALIKEWPEIGLPENTVDEYGGDYVWDNCTGFSTFEHIIDYIAQNMHFHFEGYGQDQDFDFDDDCEEKLMAVWGLNEY